MYYVRAEKSPYIEQVNPQMNSMPFIEHVGITFTSITHVSVL